MCVHLTVPPIQPHIDSRENILNDQFYICLLHIPIVLHLAWMVRKNRI